MTPISQLSQHSIFKNYTSKNQKFILTDIDDTLTDEGHLGSEAYTALWELSRAGYSVVPITGRPAGWCEMIARQWPVAGVVGENGAFYFRYINKKMKRFFFIDEKTRLKNQQKLKNIEAEVLKTIPGSAVASDQFCRLFDLAIDFCEDIPALPTTEVEKIVKIFKAHGAQAKVSSIHVNGWFGDYNKLKMALQFLQNEFHITPEQAKESCLFSGDSPNDEPMFEYFPLSVGVANVKDFITQMKSPPAFICTQRGGLGFTEIKSTLIGCQALLL